MWQQQNTCTLGHYCKRDRALVSNTAFYLVAMSKTTGSIGEQRLAQLPLHHQLSETLSCVGSNLTTLAIVTLVLLVIGEKTRVILLDIVSIAIIGAPVPVQMIPRTASTFVRLKSH